LILQRIAEKRRLKTDFCHLVAKCKTLIHSEFISGEMFSKVIVFIDGIFYGTGVADAA